MINKFIFNDDVLKSLVSYRLQITPMGTYGAKTKGPNRKHRCDTSQKPSKEVSE